MSRTLLTGLLTTAVVALSAVSASAQVVLFDPSTWMNPPRPFFGSNRNSCYANRPVMTPNVYPSYGGPGSNGSNYRGVLPCPDGMCGPINRFPMNAGCANGQCGTPTPRYPVSTAPLPYNSWRTPVPSNGYDAPGVSQAPRWNEFDRRVTPANDDDWSVTRSPRRSYDADRSPFYP